MSPFSGTSPGDYPSHFRSTTNGRVGGHLGSQINIYHPFGEKYLRHNYSHISIILPSHPSCTPSQQIVLSRSRFTFTQTSLAPRAQLLPILFGPLRRIFSFGVECSSLPRSYETRTTKTPVWNYVPSLPSLCTFTSTTPVTLHPPYRTSSLKKKTHGLTYTPVVPS